MLLKLVSDGKEELIPEELGRYKRLLDELEMECQKIQPEEEAEAQSLTKWCTQNLDPKVDFMREIENHLIAFELGPKDSAPNVLVKSNGSRVPEASAARAEARIKKMELQLELDYKKRAREIQEQEKLLAERREDLLYEAKIAKEQLRETEYGNLEKMEKDADRREPGPDRQMLPQELQSPQELLPRVRIEDVLEKVLNVQLQSTLPKRDLKAFSGNLLDYRIFIQTFESQIEKKTEDHGERLAYLLQFTEGEAHALINACVRMHPKEGFQEAKRLLKREYGNTFRIASAYRKQLEEWPTMKEDPDKMKKFAALLQRSKTAMQDLGKLEALGDHESLIRLMMKLPQHVSELGVAKSLVLKTN